MVSKVCSFVYQIYVIWNAHTRQHGKDPGELKEQSARGSIPAPAISMYHGVWGRVQIQATLKRYNDHTSGHISRAYPVF